MAKKFITYFWLYYFFILTMVAIFNLVGCEQPEATNPNIIDAKSNYVPGDVIPVRVFLYKDREELQKAYLKLPGSRKNEFVNGFSIQRYNAFYGDRLMSCDIHVIDSLVDPDPNQWVWGHELKHCVKGRYHQE